MRYKKGYCGCGELLVLLGNFEVYVLDMTQNNLMVRFQLC